MSDISLPDSGGRTEYETGAVRDSSIGKGLPSNIPPEAIRRLAKRFEAGRAKYPDSDGPNWMKGIPLSHYQDSLMRHTLAAAEGDESEDHLGAVLWNAAGWIWTLDAIESGDLPASLNDLPFYKKPQNKAERLKEKFEEAGAPLAFSGDFRVLGNAKKVLDPAPTVSQDSPKVDERPAPTIPFPEVPKGYHHWERRGWGWRSKGRTRYTWYAGVKYANLRDEWMPSYHEGQSDGEEEFYYIEAVKSSVNVGDLVRVYPIYDGAFTARITGIATVRGAPVYQFDNGVTLGSDDILSFALQ